MVQPVAFDENQGYDEESEEDQFEEKRPMLIRPTFHRISEQKSEPPDLARPTAVKSAPQQPPGTLIPNNMQEGGASSSSGRSMRDLGERLMGPPRARSMPEYRIPTPKQEVKSETLFSTWTFEEQKIWLATMLAGKSRTKASDPQDWKTAYHLEDLVVCTDPDEWAATPESHKFAARTSGFSFVENNHAQMVDITDAETCPHTSVTCYQNDSWMAHCSLEEAHKEIAGRPANDQSALLNAYCYKTESGVPQTQKPKVAPKRKAAARAEASQLERRNFAKQFSEAKRLEMKSWIEENDVLEFVDMRKNQIPNYITGRWVLTVKKDKNGNFLKCKARWVLRGFQDRQVHELQTVSPTATRPGFRLQCQLAANKNWDLTHIDLKTAFLQGDGFNEHRNIVCQLPASSRQCQTEVRAPVRPRCVVIAR